MRMVENWRRVAALSLSFWLTVAGILAMVLPEFRFYLTGQDFNPVLAWLIGIGLLIGSLVGRLFQQSDSVWREWLRIGAVVLIVLLVALTLAGRAFAGPPSEQEVLEVAVPFIAQEEGIELVAYRDIVGVWTICSGTTRGVKPGMTMTRAECRALLRREVREYRDKLRRYFSETTKQRRLTVLRDVAYTSLAFNCGVPAIGRSTAVRRLNAGDIAGGCQAIGWWNKGGGRVIRGLVARRAREQAYCMAGL